MKISAQMVTHFLAQEEHNATILIYGENFGKVMDVFEKLTEDFDYTDPFSTTVLSFYDVIKNTQLLLDNINTPAFNSKRRLVHITDAGESWPVHLQKVVEQLDCCTTFLVITCKLALSTRSTLRSFFEKSKLHKVIACYNDSGQDLRHFLVSYLQKHHINHNKAIISTISNLLTGERDNMRNELDKLIAYAGTAGEVTEGDALMCLNYDGVVDTQDICGAFAGKSLENFLRLLRNHQEHLLIIRALGQYLMRVREVLMASHDMREKVISSFKPPIFFKYLVAFKEHVKCWQASEITEVLDMLLNIEIAAKKNNMLRAKMMLEHMAIQYLSRKK